MKYILNFMQCNLLALITIPQPIILTESQKQNKSIKQNYDSIVGDYGTIELTDSWLVNNQYVIFFTRKYLNEILLPRIGKMLIFRPNLKPFSRSNVVNEIIKDFKNNQIFKQKSSLEKFTDKVYQELANKMIANINDICFYFNEIKTTEVAVYKIFHNFSNQHDELYLINPNQQHQSIEIEHQFDYVDNYNNQPTADEKSEILVALKDQFLLPMISPTIIYQRNYFYNRYLLYYGDFLNGEITKANFLEFSQTDFKNPDYFVIKNIGSGVENPRFEILAEILFDIIISDINEGFQKVPPQINKIVLKDILYT